MNDEASLPKSIAVSSEQIGKIDFDHAKIIVDVTQPHRPHLTLLVLMYAKVLERSDNYLELEIPWTEVKDTLKADVPDLLDSRILRLELWLDKRGADKSSGIIKIPLL